MQHVYGRERKRDFQSLADVDPRPNELRGNARDQMKSFNSKVKGKGLGISLLFDSDCKCWSTTLDQTPSPSPELPSKTELQERIKCLKESLQLPTPKHT